MHEPSRRRALDFLMHAPGYADAETLEQAFAAALEELGVPAFSCARQDGRNPGAAPTVLAQRGLKAWDQYMADQGYLAVNPSIRWTALGCGAFTWREVQAEGRRTGERQDQERMLWADAADNGMRDGLVVRTVASSGQVLSTRMVTGEPRIRPSDRALLESLSILFAALRQRFAEDPGEPPGSTPLTPRETECLRWAALGLPDHGIAGRLGISGNTVRNHIQNAMRKLRAPSRLAAYHRALTLGALEALPADAEA